MYQYGDRLIFESYLHGSFLRVTQRGDYVVNFDGLGARYVAPLFFDRLEPEADVFTRKDLTYDLGPV